MTESFWKPDGDPGTRIFRLRLAFIMELFLAILFGGFALTQIGVIADLLFVVLVLSSTVAALLAMGLWAAGEWPDFWEPAKELWREVRARGPKVFFE